MKFKPFAAMTASRLALGAGLALALLTGAGAQDKFPSKPIEVVTHAGVGGGTDITARMMMVQAPATLGTELTVVNKTGGSGAAALAYADSRPKDRHRILLLTLPHLLTLIQGRAGILKPAEMVEMARRRTDPRALLVGGKGPLRPRRGSLKSEGGV